MAAVDILLLIIGERRINAERSEHALLDELLAATGVRGLHDGAERHH